MMQRRTMISWGLFALFLLFCFQIDAHAVQYKVKKGENLSLISRRTGVSVAEIQKTNHLNSNIVKPGQILSIKEKNSPSPVAAKFILYRQKRRHASPDRQKNRRFRIADRQTESCHHQIPACRTEVDHPQGGAAREGARRGRGGFIGGRG